MSPSVATDSDVVAVDSPEQPASNEPTPTTLVVPMTLMEPVINVRREIMAQ